MKVAKNKKSSERRSLKLSPIYRPEGLTLEEWQIGLRKQAAKQALLFLSSMSQPSGQGVYEVSNPASQYIYKLHYFGADSSWNLCSCMDFKTNQLGTCKHLEWLKLQLEKKHPISEKEFIPFYSGLYLCYKEERKVVLRIGTDQTDRFIKLANRFFDGQSCLTDYGLEHIDQFIQKAYVLSPLFVCHEEAKQFILEKRERTAREALLLKKYPAGKFPGLLKATLYPYQEKGILFAALKGKSIIADEMGLGKTIQAIGAAELLKRDLGVSSVLVVCPTSLKYQWKKEIERFSNSKAFVVEGLHYQRKEQYKREEFYKIVSYNSLANDLKILNTMSFDMVIMDEAQRLKNWNTQIAKATKRLQSDYTIIISGTPLENRIEELYSLTQYIDPYCLGPYFRLMDSTRIANETGKTIGYKNLNAVSDQLKDILIRRRKKEISIELPERIDQTLFVPLTREQRVIHDEANTAVAQLVSKWSRMKYLSEKDRQILLNNLSVMRMVSDSTFVVDQKSRHDTKITELTQILNVYFENNGEKAVIFSQWERMTRLIVEVLEQRGIGYQYLHGGIPSVRRKDLIDCFTNDPLCKVFVSTDAGSTGLNLQAASLLINMDLPWNPAILEQRIARIHRIGQVNNIQVINFVSIDSIEERMLSVLNFKTALFDGILNGGPDSIFLENKRLEQLMEVLQPISEAQSHTIDTARFASETEGAEETLTQSGIPEQIIETTLFDDETDDSTIESQTVKTNSTNSAGDLVRQGISFFSSLADTLNSPEKTRRLLDEIVVEDAQTGETYLKISVPNKDSVGQVLQLLAKIIK